MGNLLVLPLSSKRAATCYSAGHSAEILFFTGVRYHRIADDTAAIAMTPPGRLRKRRQRPTPPAVPAAAAL